MEDKTVSIVDPSSLTTQQLWREIATLKELLIQNQNHDKELLLARIAAIEDKIKIAHDDAVRVPTEIQKQISGVKELIEAKLDNINRLKEEKFLKVDQRFELIEKQRIEQKDDTAEAVKNALISAKELFTLQNENFSKQMQEQKESFQKQMEKQAELIANNTEALGGRINDNKEKIIRIESIAAGALATKVEHREDKSINWGIVAIVASIILGLMGLFAGYFMRS